METILVQSKSYVKVHERMKYLSKHYPHRCPTSGYLMDQVISIMIDAGLEVQDFKHLERLSDRAVLQRLPKEERHLRHNRREDVVKYLNAWADLLEEQLLSQVVLPPLTSRPAEVA